MDEDVVYILRVSERHNVIVVTMDKVVNIVFAMDMETINVVIRMVVKVGLVKNVMVNDSKNDIVPT